MIIRLVALLTAVSGATWIDVPFTRQDENACGAASAWMILEYWKQSPHSPEEIHRGLYSEEAGGVFASDLEEYLAGQGLDTYSFAGQWSDLVDHVSKGRPLIVCLRANARGTPLHYVVVAGIEGDAVLINDPARGKRVSMDRADFEARWEAIGRWTLLAVPGSAAPNPGAREPKILTSTIDLEEASAAFRREDYSRAKMLGHRALSSAPSDPLGNDFLATLYFLEDNLDAALKYWNRVDKPRIRDVSPVLETEIARGNVLKRSDFIAARKRLDARASYARYQLDLQPADGDDFDLKLRGAERDGFRPLSWIRGLPYQTVMPEWVDVAGSGVNVESLFRWDSERRRAFVSLSGPGGRSLRYKAAFDFQNDAAFPMRRSEITVGVEQIATARWTWSSGVAGGPALKYTGGTSYDWWDAPERKFSVSSAIRVEAGKTRRTTARFSRLEGDTRLKWGPAQVRLRSGRVFGDAPRHEYFAVGLDRDHDLWLRAHDSRLIVRRYVLVNSEIEKSIFNAGFVGLKAAPFVDVVRAGEVFVDAGIDMRASVLSLITFSFSVGRDLKEGRTVVFTNIR